MSKEEIGRPTLYLKSGDMKATKQPHSTKYEKTPFNFVTVCFSSNLSSEDPSATSSLVIVNFFAVSATTSCTDAAEAAEFKTMR
tara:strand:- start:359 stop:610 length:252 start_codon:yes stop_codon:yes gene_type:complete